MSEEIRKANLSDIKFDRANANKGSVRGRGMIEASMREFGFADAGTLDRNNTIIGGNKRTEVAGEIALSDEAIIIDVDGTKPVYIRRNDLDLSDPDDDRARKLAYALNRSNEVSLEWDAEQLLADMQAGVDLSDLFRRDELDEILADILPKGEGGDAEPQIDRAAELQAQWGTQLGQLWQLGEHRLICGDCTDAEAVARLMGGDSINLAFTSPPYAEQRDYDKSSGFKPIPPDQYVDWFAGVARNVETHLAHNGSWFVNIKPAAEGLDTSLYVMDLVIAHVRQWGWHFVTEFCWERAGIPKQVVRRFKNQFEPIYQFTRGDFKFYPDNVRHASKNVPKARGKGAGNASWKNHQGGESIFMSGMQGTPNFEWFGDNAGEGMAYPGNRLPTFSDSHEALGHSAAFPVGLPEFFIKAYTDSADVVYEPFAGSGSTLMAAEIQGRKCRAVELSPSYLAIILQRFSDATGKTPVLV